MFHVHESDGFSTYRLGVLCVSETVAIVVGRSLVKRFGTTSCSRDLWRTKRSISALVLTATVSWKLRARAGWRA
eukprot:1937172-Prymnesium_polylepis.1